MPPGSYHPQEGSTRTSRGSAALPDRPGGLHRYRAIRERPHHHQPAWR
jgi:hypothetical protein